MISWLFTNVTSKALHYDAFPLLKSSGDETAWKENELMNV